MVIERDEETYTDRGQSERGRGEDSQNNIQAEPSVTGAKPKVRTVGASVERTS